MARRRPILVALAAWQAAAYMHERLTLRPLQLSQQQEARAQRVAPMALTRHLCRLHAADNEEDDPEIFFVRYVWEVMVESVTGNIMNWNYDEITLFAVAPPPKLDEVKPVGAPDVLGNPTSTTSLSVDLGGAAGNGASNSAKSEDIGDAV